MEKEKLPLVDVVTSLLTSDGRGEGTVIDRTALQWTMSPAAGVPADGKDGRSNASTRRLFTVWEAGGPVITAPQLWPHVRAQAAVIK